MKQATILTLFFLAGTLPAVACSGCSPIWPGIVNAAKSVKNEYFLADKEIAREYKKEIIPILKMIRKLERMIAVEHRVVVDTEIDNLVTEKGILEKLSRLRATEMLHAINPKPTSTKGVSSE